jgi:integrase
VGRTGNYIYYYGLPVHPNKRGPDASNLDARGVEVKIISKLLGHASVEITYNRYIHFFEGDIDDTLAGGRSIKGEKEGSTAIATGLPRL